MLKRIPLILLLVVHALGGGTITLAHARDVVSAPPGVEASHDGRCAILHDEMRCALCHDASARVDMAQTFTVATPSETTRVTPVRPVVSLAVAALHTAPVRAPPRPLS